MQHTGITWAGAAAAAATATGGGSWRCALPCRWWCVWPPWVSLATAAISNQQQSGATTWAYTQQAVVSGSRRGRDDVLYLRACSVASCGGPRLGYTSGCKVLPTQPPACGRRLYTSDSALNSSSKWCTLAIVMWQWRWCCLRRRTELASTRRRHGRHVPWVLA